MGRAALVGLVAAALAACAEPPGPPPVDPPIDAAAREAAAADSARHAESRAAAADLEARIARYQPELDSLLDGDGPPVLSPAALDTLAREVADGRFRALYGAYGPELFDDFDLNGDRRLDRIVATVSPSGFSGGLYLQRPDGAFVSVGRIHLYSRFMVCAEGDGAATIHSVAPAALGRVGGGQTHRVSFDGVRELADELFPVDSVGVVVPGERSRYEGFLARATEPRSGCRSACDFWGDCSD